MDRQDAFDRFDLDEDQLIDDHIDTKAYFDLGFALMHGQRHLQSDVEGPASQLVSETLLVNGLEEARPKGFVYRKRRVDYLTRDLIVLGRQFNHLCTLASWRFKKNHSVPA